MLGCECDAGACEDELVCAPPGLCESANASSSTSVDTAVSDSQATSGTTSSTNSSTTAADSTTSGSTTQGSAVRTDVLIYVTRQEYDVIPPTPLNFTPEAGLAVRETVDALCQQSAADFEDVYACDSSTAILSIDKNDTVLGLDIPPGEVFAAADPNVAIAESFSSFIAQGPSGGLGLLAAGVRASDSPDSIPGLVWTGSDATGDLGESCSNWQNDGATLTGNTAPTHIAGAGWIASGSENCNSELPLLCACWASTP